MNKVFNFFYNRLTIGVPYIWLTIFFLIPFLIVFKISLSDTAISSPPYAPVFYFSDSWGAFFEKIKNLDFESYTFLMQDVLYYRSYFSSVIIAIIATFLTLLIGYPLAYGIARAPLNIRPLLLMMVILPFWTSFLIRVYAWIGILKPEGLLNQLLMNIGLISEPLQLMNTYYAIFIGIVYSYLPFMVLPIYSTLEKMDHSLVEAANDLGCPPMSAFWKVTFPLSIPGMIAGCFLVFIPATGEFVIPDLLGGSSTLMIGKVLWNEFFFNRDWPVASAVAVVLLVVLIVPIVVFQHYQAKSQEAVK